MSLWNPISIPWGIVILTVTLFIDLYTDTRPDVSVNHLRGWWLRWIGFIPALILMGPWSAGLAFTYWSLFDPGWALIKHLYFFYVGTTAKLDTLQRKYPLLHVAKYVLGAAAIIIYIIKS